MRLFFAVAFEDSLKDAVAAAIRATGIDHPPWRWVARDNFHLTLKFLGEIPEERVAALAACAGAAMRGVTPFQIALDGLGGFPNLRRPRVLFYSVTEGSDEFVALAQRLDSALHEDLGIEKEKRAFRAHTTVARIKGPLSLALTERLEAAPAVAHPAQRVDRVVLMQSELSREGARYQVVKEFAFE